MRILIAVDFGLYGKAQIDFLRRMGGGNNCDLRVLHVIEPLSWELQTGYPGTMQLSDVVIAECRRTAQLLVNDVQDQLKGACSPKSIDVEVRDGNIANEIIAAADEFNADLVIVGSHGKSGIARFLLGSVSQTISTNSKRSVLIARINEIETEEDTKKGGNNDDDKSNAD
jgi:nucleotide-binding universal stress UspA family protein